MNPLASILLSIRSLGRNKVRTFLTMLGIVIGIASVIAMVAIGQRRRARVVGDHDHGLSLVDKPPQQPQHDHAAGRVQVARGLVGQQDQRPVDERAGDGHPLLLAAGKLVRTVSGARRQPHLLQDLACALDAFRRRNARKHHRQRHIFHCSKPRHEVKKLEDESDFATAEV